MSLYSLKYPENIQKLILMSPVGLPEKPEDFSIENLVNRTDSKLGKIGIKFAYHVWENNWPMFGVLRKASTSRSKKILGNYVRNRMELEDEEEQEAMIELFHQVMTRDCSSEVAISMILEFGAYARQPLHSKLPDLQIPVCF